MSISCVLMSLAVWCAAAALWGGSLMRPFQPEALELYREIIILSSGALVLSIVGSVARSRPVNGCIPSSGGTIWSALASVVSLALLAVAGAELSVVAWAALFGITIWSIGRVWQRGWITALGIFWFLAAGALVAAAFISWQLRVRPDLCVLPLTRLVAWILTWLGYPSVCSGSNVLIGGVVFAVDHVKSGWLALPFFTIPFYSLLFFVQGTIWQKFKTALTGTAACCVLVTTRLAFLAVLCAAGRFPPVAGLFKSLYWYGYGRSSLLYWLAPVVLVWVVLLRRLATQLGNGPALERNASCKKGSGSDSPTQSFFGLGRKARRRIWPVICLFGAMVFWSAWWWCPGWRTFFPFKLYIDETHSAWEPTYVDHTPESTFDSENNYRLLLERLAVVFDTGILLPENPPYPVSTHLPGRVRVIHCAEDAAEMYLNLPENALLVVKCPTRAYTGDEIDALVKFVDRGGNLLLIGEHTNVFTVNTHLSAVAGRFGMAFNNDSVYGISGSWPVTTKADVRINRVTENLSGFMWATSCSLDVSSPASTMVVSPPAGFSDPWNPHRRNFFSDLRPSGNTVFGSRPLIASCRYGRGKVLAFTDSTSFNNYMIGTPGREELIDGMLAWFGEGSSFDYFMPLAVALLLGHLVLLHGSGITRREWMNLTCSICLPAFALGSCLGLFLGSVAPGERFSLRPALSPALLVDAAHESRRPLMVGPHTGIMGPDSYDDFFLVLSRTGIPIRFCWPGPVTAGDLLDSSVLLVVSPTRSYTSKEIANVEQFVTGGGRLILIEGGQGSGTINSLAWTFGLRFRLPGGFGPLAAGTGLAAPTVVDGGTPLLEVNGFPVVSTVKKGNGTVLAIGDDAVFTSRYINARTRPVMIPLLCDMLQIMGREDVVKLDDIEWRRLLEIHKR